MSPGAEPCLAEKLRRNLERRACGAAPSLHLCPHSPLPLAVMPVLGREDPTNWSPGSLGAVGGGGGADGSVLEGGRKN